MKERIEIKNISEALNYVNNSDLESVLKLYKAGSGKEINFSGIYTSKEEIYSDIKSRVLEYFNDDFRELKSKISKLRKTGFDVDCIDFELLRVPLKIKILNVDFNIENYEAVKKILSSVKKQISEFHFEE